MARSAAFFDVDGTLLKGNIVEYYARLRQQQYSGLKRHFWTWFFLSKVPFYILIDKFSRRQFATRFYRNYRHLSPAQLESGVAHLFEDHLKPALYREAVDVIEDHKKQGRQVVLVTGSIEPIVRPVAEALGVSAVVCCQLREKSGRFTGELEIGPITDKEKAEAIQLHAEQHQLDLNHCYAYADSMDDIPMLEQVGHPYVINPKPRLARVARARGWDILMWSNETRLSAD